LPFDFRHGWYSREKLVAKPEARLWDCLVERNIVSPSDDAYDWVMPLDLGFGNDDIQRVYRVRDRIMVVFRASRCKDNIADLYLFCLTGLQKIIGHFVSR
jgi:hypothetical protein